MPAMPKPPPPPQKIEQHKITAVIINKVSLFENEIISVNVNKTKSDVFIATVLRCTG